MPHRMLIGYDKLYLGFIVSIGNTLHKGMVLCTVRLDDCVRQPPPKTIFDPGKTLNTISFCRSYFFVVVWCVTNLKQTEKS